jgi:hypothetical protein
MSDEGWMGFLVAALIGFFVGGFLGFWLADDVVLQYDTREKLRAACIGGSEQACRIYAIDYGRGEGWL